MALGKITDLAAQTAAGSAAQDLIEVVDVSDTSMAATGTNKKLPLSELKTFVAAPPLLPVAYATDATTSFVMTNATQAERIAGNAGPRMVRHVFLSGHTQVRATGYVVTVSSSANTPRCRIRYKTGVYNFDIAANYLPLGDAGAEVEFSVFTGATDVDTGWVNMAPAAIAAGDIQVGVSEIGGNGTQSPALSYLVVWFR